MRAVGSACSAVHQTFGAAEYDTLADWVRERILPQGSGWRSVSAWREERESAIVRIEATAKSDPSYFRKILISFLLRMSYESI